MDGYKKLYVDPDEPLNSLLDKIKEEEGDGLIFIVHSQSPVFVGQINIELIKKYSKMAKKELIFISNAKKTRNILSTAGFRVYSKIEDINSQASREKEYNECKSLLSEEGNSSPKKRSKVKNRVGLKVKILIFFSFFILATLSWAYFALPNIEVELTPVSKEKVLRSNIIGSKNSGSDFGSKGIKLIEREIDFKKDIVVDLTDTKEVGYKSAEGLLTIINDTREEVHIPKGTLVGTISGTKFKTVEDTIVPPVRVERFMDVVVGMAAGRNEVHIEALQKGSGGNVSRGRITDFVNSSYPVRIVNEEATEGGKDRSARVVSTDGLKRALDLAKRESLALAREELANSFESSLIYFNDYFSLEHQNLKANGRVGDLRDELMIESEIKINGFALEKEGLKDLIFKLYKESLKDEFKLSSPQISISDLRVNQVEEDEVEFVVESIGSVIGNINYDSIIEKIIGKSVEEAKELFDGMSQVKDYKIKPANQVNLPQFRFGIDLRVK